MSLMRTMAKERYEEIVAKKMNDWSENDWQDMIKEEEVRFKELSEFKDYIKDDPKTFPPLKLIYKQRFEKRK